MNTSVTLTLVPAPRRAPVSVVAIVATEATMAQAGLESLHRSLRHGDELIVVDQPDGVPGLDAFSYAPAPVLVPASLDELETTVDAATARARHPRVVLVRGGITTVARLDGWAELAAGDAATVRAGHQVVEVHGPTPEEDDERGAEHL